MNGVRIGGVGRNAELGEGIHGFGTIGKFGDQHEVGLQSDDGFDAGIDNAADFWFVLGGGGKIAIVGVAHEKILQTESVESFGEVGRERNDAAEVLRDLNGAAHFVGDFVGGWG